ncbi:hypothetical protein BLA60_28335 [Actinophytocola xinjiangensis]|uniref:DUF4267 domain-containing protein n=1 Tax=Actinophytocola xinjiangensis TaxID=485602 RepID=A0A7Z0WKH5_9PSEU|nr:DUF4267 domain-containing protein [Actinophytocola xinjiangensis]OLF07125.1 hypothetical protein BLA60_28335 [Actinophytocola xinjiangensis]
MITTATVLAGLVGVGIIAIGIQAFFRPERAAGFGIPNSPVDDPTFRAWLTVKAVRDIGTGVFVFVLMLAATPAVLGWYLLACSGIPFGDMAIVLRAKGPRAIAFGVHGATAVVVVAISVVLLTF